MEESRRSSGKCQKISGGEQNMTSVDRLSSLPDEVICHILSFLPTKLSVATSVLGRRWRFLWVHVPCLNFSRNDFPDETEDSDISEDDFTGQTKYSDIIHRVILLHEAKRMDTFMLDFMDCNEYHLETWINFAIKRNVRNLYLDMDLPMGIFPPRLLFTCQTVVDMRIYRCVEIRSSLYIHLPSLKKLYLYDADFENDEALPHLLSGCPLLEKLTMSVHLTEKEKYLGCINVSSPTLKTLEIDLLHIFEDDIPDYRILINAQALRHLRMVNCHLGCVTNLANMTSLAEASIRVEGPFYLFVDIGSNSNVVKFLDSLCNVKCLRMTSYGAEEVFEIGFAGSIAKFGNLTKLELELSDEWHLLADLLEVADNLQLLIFGEGEFDMVRYLLKNSRLLEKMEILPLDDKSVPNNLSEGNNLKMAFDALERISLFERGSTVCQLAFYSGERAAMASNSRNWSSS
ncbi:Unknown protein [Striga hermonthica]|uniref:F-box domain-containing protein n=1 Tax=Striga hermonthica TaxID=68872 RepID=A0A9N7R1F6_STRHE|nr:Unknown protein [Striga hermonthica]